MTRHTMRRCVHCQVVYTYQTSGQRVNWFKNQSDSGTYCKDCWEVVKTALSVVPPKVERLWVTVVDSEEIERVYAAEKAYNDDPPKLMGAIPVYRVGGSTYRFSAGGKMSRATTSYPVLMDGVEYLITRWHDESRPDEIKRAEERNLETEELRPWRDYRD